MTKLRLIPFCIAALFLMAPAQADLEVNFIESAPKDRFVIKNVGKCDLDSLVIDIDLASSEGKLIFDTTARGEGVEVFQPFEAKQGDFELVSATEVKDGDDQLTLAVKQLAVDETISFTIDVDDTLTDSALGQIRVADSEIMGGSVRMRSADISTIDAVFDSNSRALLKVKSCV